jgi:hypothetical protein
MPALYSLPVWMHGNGFFCPSTNGTEAALLPPGKDNFGNPDGNTARIIKRAASMKVGSSGKSFATAVTSSKQDLLS